MATIAGTWQRWQQSHRRSLLSTTFTKPTGTAITTAQLLAAQGLGITMVPLEYSRLTVEQGPPPALLSIDQRYEAWWDMCVATLEDGFLSKADELFIRCVSP